MIDKALKRRDILAMSAAAICLGASASAAPMAKSIDFTDPVKRLRAFMLMRGALDDRLVVGCMTGRYYGVVDDESMPLFGLASATFARFRPAADGGFEGASYEVPFFTDLTTGAALEQFVNPYTGETVTVPQSALPPSRIAISPDFVVTTPGAPPRLEYKHRILPPITSGDDVWMVEETFSAIQSPTRPKPLHYSEVTTIHARASELSAPNVRKVRCETIYESVSSWRPWLKMADHPGHLTGTGAGRYGAPLEDLPENWRKAAAVLRPDVLKAPSAPLDALLKA